MPRDIVLIEGLVVDTVIGIYDWEREIRQHVRIDLEMAWDNRPAGASDDIVDALDYKKVSKRIIALVREAEFFLVEKLAEEIAATVLSEFNVAWLQLKLSKPGAVRGAENVGVRIQRSRAEG
ncbi:MAG: dihydroneopterin aldolase [Alphaproteobacteria bacterium CG_4_10_14_0_2_um_filter_63_37]|nr:MAG: dihydroneopterin aldolase [Proteobacteria bacterium CG1_02_64_396]PJA26042.1 MAG: dihydroneopterin aldolase [Alphaproteobacteria bacterium CG_4_10_14_0_2_um_filter_63_37]